MKNYPCKTAFLAAAISFIPLCANADIAPPYRQSFDSDADFATMTVIDANKDGTTWLWDTDKAKISFNAQNDMNDWLITPAITLKAGASYKISFDVIPHMTRYITERIEVKWGNAPSAAAMTGIILEPTDLITENSEDMHVFHYEKTIKPTADGTYYIGFHGISLKDQSWLAIDNIVIDAPIMAEMPGAPTDFNVNPILDGSAKVEVSVKAPTKTSAGSQLSTLTKLDILRGETVIKSFENPKPGQQYSLTDTEATRGRTFYYARAYNANGAGEQALSEVYVDIAVPSAAPWVKAVENATEGQVTVTWAAPTTDLEGRTIDPTPLRYDIFTTDGYSSTDIETGYNGLSYTYQAVLPNEPQQFLQIGVCPTYKGEYDFSHATRSQAIAVGAPYECPFKESFVGGDEEHPLHAQVHSDEGIWGIFNDDNDFNIKAQDGDKGFTGFYSEIEGDQAVMTLGKISLKNVDNPAISFYVYNPEGMMGADLDQIALNIICEQQSTNISTFALETLPLADKWNLVIFPLDQFKGKVIQPQFAVTINNGGLVLLDNIQVKTHQAYDLAAVGISTPNEVEADTEFKVSVTVANLGSKDINDYKVTLYRNNQPTTTVAGKSVKAAKEVIVSIPQTLNVSNEGRMTYHAVIELDSDGDSSNNTSAMNVVTLKKSLYPAPSALSGSKLDNAVMLQWSEPDYSEGLNVQLTETFEGAKSWNIDNVEGWTFIDNDADDTGAFGYDFPGKNSPMAYIVFDKKHESFASEAGFDGVDNSDKYLASFYSKNKANDDWMISPLLNGQEQTISFYARSFDANYLESVQVLASSKTTAIEDFSPVANSIKNIPAAWTQYSYKLPEGTKYFAIRHISNDKFILLIDNVTYTTALLGENEKAIGYNVYRDGVRINKELITDCTFTDANIQSAEHTYAVSAQYKKAESSVSNLCVVKTSGIQNTSATTADIRVAGHTIIVSAPQADVMIATIDGKVISHSPCADEVSCSVEPGIYIVRIGSATTKLIVR